VELGSEEGGGEKGTKFISKNKLQLHVFCVVCFDVGRRKIMSSGPCGSKHARTQPAYLHEFIIMPLKH
jgi:hypothetical protein